MFVIDVQVWPHGYEPQPDIDATSRVRLAVENDGTGTHDRATYNVYPAHDGCHPIDAYYAGRGDPLLRVIGFPRQPGQKHLASLASTILGLYSTGESSALCWEMKHPDREVV